MRPLNSIALGLCLVLPLAGAPVLQAVAAEPEGPSQLIGRSDAIRITIQEQLSAKFTTTTEVRKQEHGALVEFYAAPERAPLWVDEKGLTGRGKAVIAEIRKADDYGLRSADYELPDLSGFDSKRFDSDAAGAAGQLAEAEITISFAAVRYAHDARGGRIDPQRVSGYLDPDLKLPKPLEVMESLAFRSDAAGYLRSFQPDQPQFEALRHKLAELRGGDEQKEEPATVSIPDGPTLRAGDRHPHVVLLRQRLDVAAAPEELGDGKPVDPELFDEAVDGAVKQFQVAHGLSADGLVGPGTRRVMNGGPSEHVGNEAQIRLVLLNMERWRWLPNHLGEFYVRVNIPEFKMRVVKDRKVIHSARAVVGKAGTQTPVFSDELETVVFNPTWYVPNSIKTGEIRPYIRRSGGGWFQSSTGWDTRVIERHNLRVNYRGQFVNPQSIDWDSVDIRQLAFSQPPGPTNVLGVVKFLFPNKHDVYMHDTPQRFLFSRDVRAESHGCVRVQDPSKLAAVLLGWSESQVKSTIARSHDSGYKVDSKIPVYITYFTAWVDADGKISTYGDIYGHDRRMAGALNL